MPFSSGFTVPDPYQVAARIPADAPYVVRPRLKGACRSMGIVVGLSAVGSSALLLPLLLAIPAEARGFLLALFIFTLVGSLLLVGGVLTIALMSGGPLLACDFDGLWVRSRRSPAKAIRLPWQAIAVIYPRRWGFDRVVCIRPADPAAGRGQGLFANLDQAQARWFVGARFVVAVSLAGISETEVLRTLAHYAAGRCPVRW